MLSKFATTFLSIFRIHKICPRSRLLRCLVNHICSLFQPRKSFDIKSLKITGRLKWPQATCLGKLCVKRLLLVLKGAWNRVYPLLCPPLITEEEKTLRQSHIFPGLLESICFSFDNFSLVPWWRLDRPGKSSNRLSLSKGRKFLLISGNLYSQERPIKIENSGRDVTLIFQVKRFMRWKWIQAY